MVYVIMTDTFLTNWGPAEGKVVKIIFACDTMQEARIIAANARLRRDREDIKIKKTRPHFYKSYYVIQWRYKNSAGWYSEGGPDVEEKPQAVMGICNTLSLLLIKIEYGINDFAIVRFSDEKKKRKLKIHHELSATGFIKINGCKYYMNEFVKC